MSELTQLKVEDHINILSGFPFSSDHFHASEGTRLIRIRDLLDPDGDKIYYRGNFDPRWLIKRGDVLVGMDGEFNIVRWRGEPSLLNQRMLKAEAKAQGAVDRDFFYYWCGPFLQKIEDQTAATTVKHLSVRDVNKAMVSAPPLPQQRRIAEILGTVDEVIEQSEALIAKQQQVKAGLMHDLFTRGVTATGQLRPPGVAQRTQFGWLPNGWRIGSLMDVASASRQPILTGPFGADLGNDDFVEEGVPVLRIGNVQAGRLDLDDLLFVTAAKANFLDRYRVREGDLLFARQGATTGRNALADERVEGWLINYHIIRVAFDQTRCVPAFIEAAFAGEMVKRQIERDKGRGTREGINSAQLRALELPLPSFAEQQIVAGILKDQTTLIKSTQAHLAKLRQQKQGLMHDLLTARVPVPA